MVEKEVEHKGGKDSYHHDGCTVAAADGNKACLRKERHYTLMKSSLL